MSGIITKLYPETRDEQCSMIVAELPRIKDKKLVLVSAAPASGKTINMAEVSKQFPTADGNPVFPVVIAPNDELAKQIGIVFQDEGFTLINPQNKSGTTIYKEFQDIEKAGNRGVLVVSGIGHHQTKKFTRITVVLLEFMELSNERRRKVLCHMDEFDDMLTSLTGGINSTHYHHSSNLERLARIHNSEGKDLNFFVPAREYNMIVWGWSGTMSNVTASKMSSPGYNPVDIHLLAVHPIKGLYPDTPIKGIKPEEYIPYMLAQEKRLLENPLVEGRKIKLFFANGDAIDDWCAEYTAKTGRTPAYHEISSRAKKGSSIGLAEATYIAGITKTARGWDAKTHTGEDLSSVFPMRLASDRSSQPLSANPSHPLHVETSSLFKQMIGRARDEHCQVFGPEQYDGMTAYDIYCKDFEVTCAAVTEIARYGPPGNTQYERECHGTYAAIRQNIDHRDELTPVIVEELGQLYEMTGRRLESEDEYDSLFWRARIGELLQHYLATATIKNKKEKNAAISRLIAASHSSRSGDGSGSGSGSSSGGSSTGGGGSSTGGGGSSTGGGGSSTGGGGSTSGGGVRGERELSAAVKAAVIARACGRCAACSDVASTPQIVHVKSDKEEGLATVDNLLLMCYGCHGIFDEPSIVFGPLTTGYWCKRKFNANIHTQQIAGISHENLMFRLYSDIRKLGGKLVVRRGGGVDYEYVGQFLSTKGYTFHPFTA